MLAVVPFLAVIEILIASLEVVVVIVALDLTTKLKLSAGFAPPLQHEFDAYSNDQIVSQAAAFAAVVQKNYFVRPTAADVCCLAGLANAPAASFESFSACMVTLATAAASKGHYFFSQSTDSVSYW